MTLREQSLPFQFSNLRRISLFRILLLALPLLFVFSSAGFAYDKTDSYFIDPTVDKTVSMDFKNMDLTDVIKVFSKQSGMNFVVADDIANEKVTVFFENVTVDEALRRILDARKLTYESIPGSNVFIVKKKGGALITKVYRLKYASVSSSKLNSSSSNLDTNQLLGSSGTSGSSLTAGATSTGNGSGLVTLLRAAMSKEGIVLEDRRTNSLVITDIESYFPTIEAIITKLDVPVVQVMIEVEMLDISKQTSDKIGLKYGDTPFKVTGGSRQVIYPWDQNFLNSKGEFSPGSQYTAGKIDATGMSVLLNFLKTQTDTRNLAKPRLLTLDNETAQIKISTNEAIGETSNENGQTGAVSAQAERVQTGVFLSVTPQVNLERREILMSVSPKVIQARSGATFKSTTYKDPEERGTQSLLKVKDGQTIVLGGLLREDDSNTVTKLPVLGDIPLIGSAFRHKDKTNVQRELIIFITPHIIDDSNDQALLKQSSQTNPGSDALEVNQALDKIEMAR